LDETLSTIAKQGPPGYYSLKELAHHFAASDPQKALRCAEEAVLQARNLDQPDRALGLAEMGALVVRLGNKESGRKLLDQAAEMAAQWKASDRNVVALGSLAVAVAPSDLSKAMSLLEKLPRSDRPRYQAKIAVALDDLDKAQSLLKSTDSWYAERGMVSLALRIAASRPAEAVRLIEKWDLPKGYGDTEQTKATAFGWLAAAIGPQDRARACSLVDRAFATYRQPSGRSFEVYGGRAAQAALLAAQAKAIGHPDVQGLVYRVLAMRPTSKNSYSPVAAQESNVAIALFLAMADPGAAKQILQVIEPASDAIGTGCTGIGRDTWFNAWALADPQRAMELVERELASAKGNPAVENARRSATEMARLWATPPKDRPKLLAERFGNLASPAEHW
jgi:hypothetical protein